MYRAASTTNGGKSDRSCGDDDEAGDNTAVLGSENPGQVAQFRALQQAIESEVIPRLMLAHRDDGRQETTEGAAKSGLGPQSVNEFTSIILAGDFDAATAYVEALRGQSADYENILLGLLGPTARRLGEMWEEDLCDFTAVTIGLVRLHRVLHSLGAGEPGAFVSPLSDRRILLTPVPGEQHVFGLLMVGEFFRRAGWTVWGDSSESTEDALQLISEIDFPLVGLSVSSELWLDRLGELIAELRDRSVNRETKVLVGGQIFLKEPDLVRQIGADAMAFNGRQAILEAERLISASQPAVRSS